MARRKVGAMSTGTTIALVGGAALLIYLMSKKTTPTPTVAIPAGTLALSANPTNTAITAGASIANNLINSLFS